MSITVSATNLYLNAAGTVSEITVSNTGAAAIALRLWVTCVGNKAPASATIPEGKELVEERWVEAREAGGTWQSVGFPAEFPLKLEDLSDALLVSIAAGSSKTLQLRLVVPVGASTSGTVNYELAGRVINA